MCREKYAPESRSRRRVDDQRRSAIRRAHSATHILHYALQKNLGRHAQQQGSKVDTDWLRFDFTNLSAVTDEQLVQVERDVKERVQARQPVRWDYVPLADAREKGAMMLFGEKYPDPVRLVTMGDFSRELCGGTHVSNTEDVGDFEIVSEESVSTGTRRIVALTGTKATDHEQQTRKTLQQAADALGIAVQAVPAAAQPGTSTARSAKTAGVRYQPSVGTGVTRGWSDRNDGTDLRATARLAPRGSPHVERCPAGRAGAAPNRWWENWQRSRRVWPNSLEAGCCRPMR